MKTSPLAILLLLISIFASYQARAENGQPQDAIFQKIQRLAHKWYGEGTKIDEVKNWKAIRIIVQGYNTVGESSWLILFPEKPMETYNACVVPMSVDSDSNHYVAMSKEAKNALLSISKRTLVSGVSTDTKLNDLVIPYLLSPRVEDNEELTKGTYYYFPLGNVREYKLDLKQKDPNANYIPVEASVYIDEHNFLVHRKITGVVTISRGEKSPKEDE